MSLAHNVTVATEGCEEYHDIPSQRKGIVNHPENCKHECPYGFDRAFCWPCMKKIMEEHNATRRGTTYES